MFAQIKHVAMISENYTLVGKFYEALFGMKVSGKPRPTRAVTVGDGYVGFNINPRRVGRKAGIDHFGIEVEDAEFAFARLREAYPEIRWLQRPSERPFAGITAHDPDGNIFDISQKDMKNRTDIYVEKEWTQARAISHVGIRTLHPERMAAFYAEMFQLTVLNKAEDDANFYLSDGRITLELIPWNITDYAGTGIVAAGIDHVGFKVESIDAVMKDLEDIAGVNHRLGPTPYAGKEGKAWLDLFCRGCRRGTHHIADPDGVPIALAVA